MKKRFSYFTLILVLILLNATSSFLSAQNQSFKNGKYKISIQLKDKIEQTPIAANKKIYLLKERWGKDAIVIDSAIISTKKEAIFEGNVYSLYRCIQANNSVESVANLFTSGCYQIRYNHNILFKLFFSNIDGGSFNERIECGESGSDYIQNYRRIAHRKDKYGTENELFLTYQFFNKLMALTHSRDMKVRVAAEEKIKQMGIDSIRNIIPNLSFRANKEAEYSIFNLLIKGEQNSSAPTKAKVYTDDRLYFTEFGKVLFDKELKRINLYPRRMAIDSINKTLSDSHIRIPELKSKTIWESFEFFKQSTIMGSESIAISIADNFILNKKVEVDNNQYFEAEYFSNLNRNSLLGMYAPQMKLKDIDGKERELSESLGNYTIIFFYTDDCTHCKNETNSLFNFFDTYTSTPLNLYAVYTGNSKEKWQEYIKENFKTINAFVNRIDVADIQKESKAFLDYGITSTPAIYLLDSNHKIIGRKVRTENIREILSNELQYKDKMNRYFEQLFVGSNLELKKRRIDTLYNATTDVDNFKYEFFNDLFIYLMNSDEYTNQLGAEYIGEKYICPQKESWPNRKFAEDVCHAIELFNLNKLGEKASDLNLYTINDLPKNLISKENKYQVLYFFSPNCGLCNLTTDEMKKLFKEFGKKVVFTSIYTGNDIAECKKYIVKNRINYEVLYDKSQEGILHKSYDIESVPAIYLLDKDKRVIAKDITVEDLKKLIKEL